MIFVPDEVVGDVEHPEGRVSLLLLLLLPCGECGNSRRDGGQ